MPHGVTMSTFEIYQWIEFMRYFGGFIDAERSPNVKILLFATTFMSAQIL